MHTNSKLCLDCFDGYLTGLYGKNGFKETHREKNWTAGEPDIVHMSFDRLLLSNTQRAEILRTISKQSHTPLTDLQKNNHKEVIKKETSNPYLKF